MKKLLSVFVAAFTLTTLADYDAATAAAESVHDVVVRQQWPWSTKVVVSFRVSGLEATNSVNVTLSGSVGGAHIDIPAGAVKGSKFGLENGTWELSFDPADVPALVDMKSVRDFRATVTPTLSALDPSAPFYTEPLYMIVDLQATNNPANAIQYLRGRDILSGEYGGYSYAPEWIDESSVSSLIWTGVTSNDVYKTTKLVLRRIPAGTFNMGSRNGEAVNADHVNREDYHQVTLTKDYWIGVFEVTQRQWLLLMGGTNPAERQGNTQPIEKISYVNIRGAESGTNWPVNADVDASSFIGKLRTKTNYMFDLPTDAQWEYACRAGTTTALNSGHNLTDAKTCSNMSALGRYKGNQADGRGGVNYHHTVVGSYLPNSWGLYDMHGNVWEWCLDWFKDHLGNDAVVDPVGVQASEGTLVDGAIQRVLHGGAWRNDALNCRSAFRSRVKPGNIGSDSGFRIACTAEFD